MANAAITKLTENRYILFVFCLFVVFLNTISIYKTRREKLKKEIFCLDQPPYSTTVEMALRKFNNEPVNINEKVVLCFFVCQ